MYLCTWYHLALNSTMAKVGYIFKAAGYDCFDTDVEWMKQYGCVQVVRIISIHDKVDSRGDLFPETKAADVLEIFGALPEECAALRKASAHIIQLKQNINQPSKENNISKAEREKTIVAMYNNGHSIDDIWKVSGFNSRSSVFRILNKYGVSLNRGKFSGPLGKRKSKEE